MKLSHLISEYGDDAVQFQNLDQCATDLNMGKKGKKGTKITFGTEQRIDLKGTEKLGLIVWMDRDRVAQIIEAWNRRAALTPREEAPAEGAEEIMQACVDWDEYADDIADVISDSMDMDWTSSDGARAVVRWLNENAPFKAQGDRK